MRYDIVVVLKYRDLLPTQSSIRAAYTIKFTIPRQLKNTNLLHFLQMFRKLKTFSNDVIVLILQVTFTIKNVIYTNNIFRDIGKIKESSTCNFIFLTIR